jgi:hypothetical protein
MTYLLKYSLPVISLSQSKTLTGILVCTAFVLASQFMGTEVTGMGALKLSSPAFKHNQMIPTKHTCDGANVNHLVIDSTPPGKSLAFDHNDRRAGIFLDPLGLEHRSEERNQKGLSLLPLSRE